MKYLVTGGAGFIGSHIVEELSRRGESVVVLDNLSTGKWENLTAVNGPVGLIEGDVRNLKDCCGAVEGVDYVLHLAALVSVPHSLKHPRTTHAVNVDGTLNMLIAARDAGVKGFVFASSSAVYGDSRTFPQREGSEGCPLSPYAVSKLAGEAYCRMFSALYGMPTVSLRYFNVFGPRQDPSSFYGAAIPRFISSALQGERPVIYGDGGQSRDFVYVDDVACANIQAVQNAAFRGEAINIGKGIGISIADVASTVIAVTGADITPVYEPARPGDVRHSRADISRAVELLGYRPGPAFADRLWSTIRWYEEHKEPA